MADYRCTWFFETIQAAKIGASAALGWTETWYLSGINEGGIDGVFKHRDVTRYATLRRQILGAQSRIAFLRVSDDKNPRLVKVAAYESFLGNFKAEDTDPNVIPKFAQTQCAVLIDFQRLPVDPEHQEPVHHKRFLLRGLPYRLLDGNVLDVNSGPYKLLLDFCNFLGRKMTGAELDPLVQVASNLGIRYHDPAATWVRITEAQLSPGDGSNRTLKITPALPGMIFTPYPSRIEVRDFAAPLSPWNRTWSFLSYAGAGPIFDSIVVGRARRELPAALYPDKGGNSARMREAKFKYGTINQYAIIGLRTKKTGRLFRQLRGRVSNRA